MIVFIICLPFLMAQKARHSKTLADTLDLVLVASSQGEETGCWMELTTGVSEFKVYSLLVNYGRLWRLPDKRGYGQDQSRPRRLTTYGIHQSLS